MTEAMVPMKYTNKYGKIPIYEIQRPIPEEVLLKIKSNNRTYKMHKYVF